MSVDADGNLRSDRMAWLFVLGGIAANGAVAVGYYVAMVSLAAHRAGLDAAMATTAVFVAMIVLVNYLMMRATGGKTSLCSTSAAARRFRRRQFIAVATYSALLFAAIWLKFKVHLGLFAWPVAVLPALSLLGLVAAMGLYLREETDEFERTVQVESALWATAGVLGLSSTWGFLEMLAGAPMAPSWVWFPAWSVALGLANLFTRRRFR